MTDPRRFRLAIDIGGTFTDVVLANGQGGALISTKVPTTPRNPTDAALDGAARVLEAAGADWGQIAGFIHGTTLATNALIERRGARVATVTTEGFRDILEIAYERRYSQYDIGLVKPDLLVPRERSFTIGGRMNAVAGELTALDEAAVSRLVGELRGFDTEAVAICLMHAYANPVHEQRLRELLAAALPDLVVSISSDVSPEAREFDRLCTTIANAYIQPLMARYLADFAARFAARGVTCPVLMMTASGGMTTIETAARLPIRLVESGPAGGAILAARIAAEVGAREVLSFDMGGTTAKLCLIDDFTPQSARKFEVGRAARFIKGSGMPVRIPVLEMIEIGAGGGSIARVDTLGRVIVGPESAGSDPGPAGFGRGGVQPTVTDADIVLGLIEPGRFAEGRLTIDRAASKVAIAADVGAALGVDTLDAAAAVSEIVDESMASAGRMHAVGSGKDLGARLMIAFGGNGPLHATRVARRAGVDRILIPRDPGVGSAVGFLDAPVSFEIVRSRYQTLDTLDVAGLNGFFDAMIFEAQEVVRAGAPGVSADVRRSAFMRYHGQGHEIEIALPGRALEECDVAGLQVAFEAEYSRQFTRVVPGMAIEILNWAVRVATPTPALVPLILPPAQGQPTPVSAREIRCELSGQRVEAALYDRAGLLPGDRLQGPALITEPQTTTYVSADFSAHVDQGGNLFLERMTVEAAQ